IWIAPLPSSRASFNLALKRCNLDLRFVKTSSIDAIASSIVHEATHARLWHRGIGYPEELRYRIESACIRRQLAFAHRLPAQRGVGVREEVKKMLTLAPSFWSNEEITKRREGGELALAREAGIPDWLRRSLQGIRALFERSRTRLKGSA
ncbi:MAG: hypothetical protein WAV02_07545, partial [Stellaceae bacterium]